MRCLSFCFLFFSVMLPLTAAAQVSISPTALFIHDDTNVATLHIANRSDQPQEIELNARFGYSDSDEEGNLIMNYEDAETEAEFGLTDQLRIFPRSVTLEPRSQQMVRLQVRPEPGKPDGVYWTRLSILSNVITPDLETGTTDGIGTRITYRFEQNIGVYYRRGETRTGLEVLSVDTRREGDNLRVIPELRREGNSPFMGNMRITLYNSAGEEQAMSERTFTAFFTQKRPIEVDVSGLAPGSYRAELRFETRRRDMKPEDMVQADTVTHTLNITL